MQATRPSGNLMARPVMVAAVVAVALGILAMHAISLHGVCHQPTLAGVTSAMTPEMGHPALDGPGFAASHHHAAASGHDEPSVSAIGDDTRAGVAPPSGAAARTAGDRGLGHMVLLCVAMLAAAAGTLLALRSLVRRAPRVWAVLRSAPVHRITGWLTPTGTGPPPVWEFSVIRC
jgi:hypothetical protein